MSIPSVSAVGVLPQDLDKRQASSDCYFEDGLAVANGGELQASTSRLHFCAVRPGIVAGSQTPIDVGYLALRDPGLEDLGPVG
jgi:hypothetical protein